MWCGLKFWAPKLKMWINDSGHLKPLSLTSPGLSRRLLLSRTLSGLSFPKFQPVIYGVWIMCLIRVGLGFLCASDFQDLTAVHKDCGYTVFWLLSILKIILQQSLITFTFMIVFLIPVTTYGRRVMSGFSAFWFCALMETADFRMPRSHLMRKHQSREAGRLWNLHVSIKRSDRPDASAQLHFTLMQTIRLLSDLKINFPSSIWTLE